MLIRIFLLFLTIEFVVSNSIYDLVISSVQCDCNRSADKNVSELKLHVYNYETNKYYSYLLSNAFKIITSGPDFDLEQCLHVFIPGFNNNINSTPSDVVRCALANYTCNSKNILLGIVDHSAYLSGDFLEEINYVGLYQKAVSNTKSVSIAIGKFMASMLQVLGKDKVMLSGHSLGGQMAGAVAEYTKSVGYPMRTVFAMDPAGPCYEKCPDEHVKSGQADVVIAIHCNSGELGSNLNLADFDVQCGNGVTQVGCKGGNSIDLLIKGQASICSHSKCVPIAMQTAIESGIWEATECDSYKDFEDKSCEANNKILASYGNSPNENSMKGVYYFDPDDDLTCAS